MRIPHKLRILLGTYVHSDVLRALQCIALGFRGWLRIMQGHAFALPTEDSHPKLQGSGSEGVGGVGFKVDGYCTGLRPRCPKKMATSRLSYSTAVKLETKHDMKHCSPLFVWVGLHLNSSD